MYFYDLPKFIIPRNFHSLNSISYLKNFDCFTHFFPASSALYYMGYNLLFFCAVGIFFQKGALKIIFIFYLAFIIIISCFVRSSNLLINIAYLCIPNFKLESNYECFINYSYWIFLIFFVYGIKFFIESDYSINSGIEKIYKSFQKIFVGFLFIFFITACFKYFWIDTTYNLKKMDAIFNWLYYLLIFLCSSILLLQFYIKKKKEAVLALTALMILAELNFLSSYRWQYGIDYAKYDYIKTLKITNNKIFNNNIYPLSGDTIIDKNTYTCSMREMKFFFPVEESQISDNYHNFKTHISSAFAKSDYYNNYTKVLNKKIMFFSVDSVKNISEKTIIKTDIPITLDSAHKYIDQLKNTEVHQEKIKFNVVEHFSDSIKFSVDSSNKLYVLFHQTFDKNWKLQIDDLNAVIFKANTHFLGFSIPAGKHNIKLIYKNNLLRNLIFLNYIITFIVLFFVYRQYYF